MRTGLALVLLATMAASRWVCWCRNRDAQFDDPVADGEPDRWFRAQVAISDFWMTVPFIVIILAVWLMGVVK